MNRAAALLLTCFLALPSVAEEPVDETAERQYTFAWQFTEDSEMRPRGGTTKGPPVTLLTTPTAEWQALRHAELSEFEKDRQAILAMAGPYRSSFDFIETVGFTPGYTPDRPYQSWGTEYVYVVEDGGDFISLQHVIVMEFVGEDGEVAEPAVVKHWRQDWQYEDRILSVYTGNRRWEKRKLTESQVRGTWSQAVFQVDDSPRYEAIGRWRHEGNFSSWQSENTWRPLPRREFSVRDDYQVLSGTNRHTITPTGWVQLEDNLKLALDEDGEPRGDLPYLAQEAGLNRYERITGFDFTPGDEYWERTGPFWADVRDAWEDIRMQRSAFSIAAEVDGERLFSVMFEFADGIESAASYDASAGKEFIRSTLAAYVR